MQRSCQYDFPNAFTGLKKVSLLNALTVDSTYGGWDTTTERLIFANGERKHARSPIRVYSGDDGR